MNELKICLNFLTVEIVLIFVVEMILYMEQQSSSINEIIMYPSYTNWH